MPEETNAIQAFEFLIERVMDRYNTVFPGTIITSQPPVDGLVTVQPNTKFKMRGSDKEITQKPINNVVLIRTDRTINTVSRPPVESLVGSKVLVLACDHAITEWRSSGGDSVYPSDERRFNINDAIAILGLYPETVPFSTTPQKPLTWELLGKPGVKFSIGTSVADLLNIVFKMNAALIASPTLDAGTKTLLTAQQALLATITNIV